MEISLMEFVAGFVTGIVITIVVVIAALYFGGFPDEP